MLTQLFFTFCGCATIALGGYMMHVGSKSNHINMFGAIFSGYLFIIGGFFCLCITWYPKINALFLR
jgi:hypothetical protein